MTALSKLIHAGQAVTAHRPWPRAVVGVDAWRTAIERLADESFCLVSLWGEPGWAHMAVIAKDSAGPAVLSLECAAGGYPSVGARHAPAIRLERALFDLVGLAPEGAIDRRPWLDHGRWAVRHPLGANEAAPAQADYGQAAYAFLPAQGESLHQIAVGPVHASVIEPGHFRFNVNGETVVRLEERLGYVHRGLEARMVGAPVERAGALAARASGDSTVAYSIAFARAAEAALGIEAPPRAAWLRALMAELERLANHLGDIG